MTARDDEALIAGLSEAARRVATQDANDDAAPGPIPEAWHRLRQRRDRPPWSLRRRWALPAVAFAALALAAGGWLTRRHRPLTFVVSGGGVEANGYVVRAGLEPTELRFSDGTRVSLARGARMSVGAPGPHGARLRVEDGQAHFEVTHRPDADWSVEAGPYRVQVTGTVFDVRWSGDDEAAAVGLRQGSVRVTGPNLAAPVVLIAGQRLVARLSTGQVRLESGGLEASEATGEAANDAADDARPRATTPVAPPAAPTPTIVLPAPVHAARPEHAAVTKPRAPAVGPSTWPARVASGESAAVLAEARAAVFDDVIGTVDAQALGALADAARYSGARDLSARALVELRRRFPATGGARAAAFQLGRMADDGGDARAALDWYRRYQSEAPRGPYAAEAVGREMIAVERLSGRAAAAPIARAYLERFPDGTYLLQARAILGTP
jgi:ferric-dicitrate binding protein FerR (iron transport regulator)